MNTKEKILAIAKEEFMEKGFQNASLRVIANRCEISATALYRHYQNKEDIFQAVIFPVISYFNEMAKEIEAIDYSYLEKDSLDEMWSYEESGQFHFDFLFKNNQDLIQLIIKERKPWFKSFIVGFEEESTIRYISRMKELGYMVKEFNRKAFHILLDSYLEAYLDLFDLKLKGDELKDIALSINQFYTIGFRDLLGF